MRRATPRAARRPAILDRFRPRSDTQFLQRVIAATLRVHRKAIPVVLLLTGEREIARIHARHLADPRGTDVISFAIDGTAELVVSVERARREAKRRGHPIKHELALYVVHGLLHVFGYDDTSTVARARMRAAELRVLLALGIEIASVDS